MLPTFFLAGAAKAGTSSMHTYLAQHPDIFLSEIKEPHHFSYQDDGWPTWAVKDRAEYEALFAAARPDQQRGEASTWTLYSEGAPERIARVVPDAKIIALLRNPTARAYSNWVFNRTGGYESLESFEAALDAETDRIAQGSAWHLHYVAAGLYHDQVERHMDVFGRERVLVLPFEDLKTDAHRLVRETFDFLGVDPSVEVDVDLIRNKTFVPRHPWLQRFNRSAGPLKRTLKTLLPDDLRDRLGAKVKDYNQVVPPRIAPETRRRLDETFRDDARRLSDLTGRDFYGRWFS